MKQSVSGYRPGSLLDRLYRMHAPINVVVALGSAIEEGLFGPLSDEQRAYLENVVTSGEMLADLVTEVSEDIGAPEPPLKNPSI